MHFFSIIFSLFCFQFANGWNKDIFNTFPATSIKNASETKYLLSDEELSFQFTLSWLTYLNKDKWLDPWGLQDNPSQASFASLRYQLAFTTYAAVSTCYKTPAYRQTCINIISNTIERMINNTTWVHEMNNQWGPNSYHTSSDSCITPDTNNSHWLKPFIMTKSKTMSKYTRIVSRSNFFQNWREIFIKNFFSPAKCCKRRDISCIVLY